jgi:glycosyltransferase involved in cell wall biosynthesis
VAARFAIAVEKTLMARILALTSRVPWPPREGHQLRSYHLLDALASQHEVHLLSCLRGEDDPAAGSPLRDKLTGFEALPIPAEQSRAGLASALTRSVLTRTPFVVAKYAFAALRRRVAELAGRFDLVHVDMLPLMAVVTGIDPRIPVVLNAHNVEHGLLAARIDVEPGLAARSFLRNQLPKLRTFESDACRRASTVLACSEDDAAQLRHMAADTPIQVVPNGVDLETNRPGGTPSKPLQMVFVGQMGWFPNRDGVEWFLSDILPRIVAEQPRARFVIIGKSGSLVVSERLRGNVELAGFVDDVRKPVLESAVYVVPLRAGSGTRLKVLEAMALGKAIVTTRIGAEGIELEPGRDALFADDDAGFARAVLHLMERPEEIERLGAAARKAAERRYGWTQIGRAMLPAYARLLT